MTYPQLTASRLELAAKCSAAFSHEHVSTTNEAAERGSQVHEYVATLLTGSHEPPLPADKKAAELCNSLHEHELRDTAQPDANAAFYAEVALYYLPGSGEAGAIEGSYHRDYSAAPEGSLAGTADAIAVEDTRVRVTDWKTGAREVPDPAGNYQLGLLGLAAARVFDKDEAIVQIARLREDGSVELRSARLHREDLQQLETTIDRIARRVEQARDGEPVYHTGSHCRFCPALPHCPAVAGAAQAILDGPPEELTPKRAAGMWAQLQAVEAAAKRTREALQEYAYARPVPTVDGWQLKVIETRRESVDSSKAFHVLREYLPTDDTIAEAVSVTKSSLGGALDKDTQKEVLASFKEVGAVNESYSESLREVRK